LRFGLTSEGGLNDALAFPFVYFGLYSLKIILTGLKHWVAIDLIWAIAAGIVMGLIVARLSSGLTKKYKKHHDVDHVMENFVALSTIY